MSAMNAVDHGHVEVPEGVFAAHACAQRKFNAVAGYINTRAGAKHQVFVIRAEDDLMMPVKRIVLLLTYRKASSEKRLALWRQQ